MLRRVCCALGVAVLLSGLCACTDINVPFELKPFTSQVSFQSAGTQIKGELTYSSSQEMSFEISEPENIKGLKFNKSGESVSLAMGRVSSVTIAEKESPVYILFGCLADISNSQLSIPCGGEKEISAEYDGKACRIKIDCDNKKLKSVETEGYCFIFE